jgi:hypothetical protein
MEQRALKNVNSYWSTKIRDMCGVYYKNIMTFVSDDCKGAFTVNL